MGADSERLERRDYANVHACMRRHRFSFKQAHASA